MLKRLIRKWLFNYSTPQYFEAIQFYKNMKWDDVRDTGGGESICSKEINGFLLAYYDRGSRRNKDYNNWWTLYNRNNPNESFYKCEQIKDYETLILRLHDIIHFGIIVPKEPK